MGVELLAVKRRGRKAVFYCNTSGNVFGPLMDRYVGQRFMEQLTEDPRDLHRRGELRERYTSFRDEWLAADP